MIMDKQSVQKLVDVKSERISYGNNSAKVSSEVWKHFVRVKVDNVYSDFVKCIKCYHVLTWKSRDGTRGLKAHVDACCKTNNVRKLSDKPIFAAVKEPVVPSVVKADIADTVVRMCAVDMRPWLCSAGE